MASHFHEIGERPVCPPGFPATLGVEYTGRVIQFTSTDANRTPVWLEPSEIQSFAPGPIQGTLIHMKNGETYSVLESAEDVAAQIPSK